MSVPLLASGSVRRTLHFQRRLQLWQLQTEAFADQTLCREVAW
jgi:hypothetical protein